jgi:hypothetical protein
MLTTLLKPVSGGATVFGVDAAARPMLIRWMIGVQPDPRRRPAGIGLLAYLAPGILARRPAGQRPDVRTAGREDTAAAPQLSRTRTGAPRA